MSNFIVSASLRSTHSLPTPSVLASSSAEGNQQFQLPPPWEKQPLEVSTSHETLWPLRYAYNQYFGVNVKHCPFQTHLHVFSFQRLKNPEQHHYYNKVTPEPSKTTNVDPLNPTTNIDRLKNIGHLKQALAQSYQTVPGYLSVEDIRYGLLYINSGLCDSGNCISISILEDPRFAISRYQYQYLVQ